MHYLQGILVLSLVPRAGVEPARVAPLVFETSASTDSAIWAFDFVFLIRTSAIETSFIALGLSSVAVAKVRHFCETAKLFVRFFIPGRDTEDK